MASTHHSAPVITGRKSKIPNGNMMKDILMVTYRKIRSLLSVRNLSKNRSVLLNTLSLNVGSVRGCNVCIK